MHRLKRWRLTLRTLISRNARFVPYIAHYSAHSLTKHPHSNPQIVLTISYHLFPLYNKLIPIVKSSPLSPSNFLLHFCPTSLTIPFPISPTLPCYLPPSYPLTYTPITRRRKRLKLVTTSWLMSMCSESYVL